MEFHGPRLSVITIGIPYRSPESKRSKVGTTLYTFWTSPQPAPSHVAPLTFGRALGCALGRTFRHTPLRCALPLLRQLLLLPRLRDLQNPQLRLRLLLLLKHVIVVLLPARRGTALVPQHPLPLDALRHPALHRRERLRGPQGPGFEGFPRVEEPHAVRAEVPREAGVGGVVEGRRERSGLFHEFGVCACEDFSRLCGVAVSFLQLAVRQPDLDVLRPLQQPLVQLPCAIDVALLDLEIDRGLPHQLRRVQLGLRLGQRVNFSAPRGLREGGLEGGELEVRLRA
mmetsp:Transcript_26949/g.67632  ORF Transcript_26949/g.67632 Transcript_26949/m.67632 type:complete len:284 (+) Transcript_26949:512-1363(+)